MTNVQVTFYWDVLGECPHFIKRSSPFAGMMDLGRASRDLADRCSDVPKLSISLESLVKTKGYAWETTSLDPFFSPKTKMS